MCWTRSAWMPKLPCDVSHEPLVRFLKERGWDAVEGSRHTLLVNGTDEVTVRRRSKVRVGTSAQIPKRAAVPRDDWCER